MTLGPYRLWPRFRPDMVELGTRLTVGSVLGELAFAALLAHPAIARWIEIPPHVGVGLVLLHVACFCLQSWLVTPRANRSPRWFHAQLAMVLAYNLGICMAFVVLARDPKTPWWMAPLLYACVTGAVQEMDASLVHLATFVLAPVATIPLFLAEGSPHAGSGWSIAAPLIAGGLCGLAYDLLARSSAVWRDERHRLRHRLAELERRQLARELHDGVGSTLAIVGLYGELVERHLDAPEELRRIVGEMRAATREGLAELRGVLEAAAPEATDLRALAATLRRIAVRGADAGEARITVDDEGLPDQ